MTLGPQHSTKGAQHSLTGAEISVGGRLVSLSSPDLSEVTLEDVGYALSNICRFVGQRRISVAEHSVRLADRVSPAMQRWALLHDAPEILVGDISSAAKFVMRHMERVCVWDELEERAARAVEERWPSAALDPQLWDAAKDAHTKQTTWEIHGNPRRQLRAERWERIWIERAYAAGLA